MFRQTCYRIFYAMKTRKPKICLLENRTQNLSGIALVLAVCISFNPLASRAQGTIYTSRSEFDTALASSTTITFDGVVPFDPQNIGVPLVSASGVTFSNAESRLFVSSSSV